MKRSTRKDRLEYKPKLSRTQNEGKQTNFAMRKETWFTKLTLQGKREYDRGSYLEVIRFKFSYEVIMKSK